MLKFAPQRSSLMAALQQAQETYGSTVRAGNSTAALTQQAAQQALPQIGQIYSKAGAAQQAGTTLLSKDLAGLGSSPSLDQYKADQAGEVQQQLANLLGAKTRDEGMLANAGTAAREGAQFNQTQARSVLQKTLQTLLSQGNAAAQEQGSFAATEAEKLAHEAETLQQRERSSERSASTSEANSKRSSATSEADSIRAHPSGAGGVKPLSTAQINAGATTVSSIRNYARSLAAKGLTRAQLVAELSTGSPGQSIGVNAAGKPVKEGEKALQHIKVPAVPAYKPEVLMSAALDEALMGHLSKNTEDRLTRAGYSIKQMGLKPSEPTAEAVAHALPSIRLPSL
jgi:hypothetical protein